MVLLTAILTANYSARECLLSYSKLHALWVNMPYVFVARWIPAPELRTFSENSFCGMHSLPNKNLKSRCPPYVVQHRLLQYRRGGISSFFLVFMWYGTSIAEISVLGATRKGGVSHPISSHWETPKPMSLDVQHGGTSEIVSQQHAMQEH